MSEYTDRLDEQVKASFSTPPPIIGKSDLHTQTCIALRRAGIVKRCTCPKEAR